MYWRAVVGTTEGNRKAIISTQIVIIPVCDSRRSTVGIATTLIIAGCGNITETTYFTSILLCDRAFEAACTWLTRIVIAMRMASGCFMIEFELLIMI